MCKEKILLASDKIKFEAFRKRFDALIIMRTSNECHFFNLEKRYFKWYIIKTYCESFKDL